LLNVSYVPQPEEIMVNNVALACFVCTHSDLTKFNDMSINDKKQLISRVVKKGHLSILRHANFVFNVTGCTRVLTHQLVRHQAGFNFSQQSLRYTKIEEDNNDFYDIPDTLKNSRFNFKIENEMENVKNLYLEIIEDGYKAEDARYVLPIGTKSNIVFSANGQSLYNFFKSRCCTRAQTEIRMLALKIYELMIKLYPYMFIDCYTDCKNCKEPCKTLGT